MIKFKNLFISKKLYLLFVFLLASCGGGGSNVPVSEVPNETVLEDESASNLFPILDLKEIETPEYFNQWGLDFINASSAYVIGATGEGITVAVVDEALDWGHHEFLREGILHPDSILTYSGNREPTPWEKFHGTATSSIIVARRDEKDIANNMQGVAYESQILFIATELGEPPADGDYVPTTIEKYDWSYYDQSEANLYNELSSKADIVNNSFGFTGQITDYPKETFESNFPKFINSLEENKETIFVWSAGNYNGITDTNGEKVDAADPGWLAGLSYYFPELADNNIAVVAVDREGKIADWSNRCGVVKNACIAAPGSRINVAIPNNLYNSLSDKEKNGLNEDVLEYLKNHPTEAYLLASGTSFAAPHVTGALAVLAGAFKDNLSAKEIIDRLYKTANKEGEYANEAIYGQGLLDLGAAVSPVGFLSAYSGNLSSANSFSLESSYLKTGMSFGNSLKISLKNDNIALFDALGAPFFIPASNFFQSNISYNQLDRLKGLKTDRYQSSTRNTFAFSSWNNITNSNGYNGLRLSDAGFSIKDSSIDFSLYYGLSPSAHLFDPRKRFKLSKSFMDKNIFNIPWLISAEDGFSFSIASDLISKNISMTFFSGLEREKNWLSLPSFVIPKKNRSFGSYISFEKGNLRNYQSKNSFGLLINKEDYLSNSFSGVFGDIRNTKSLFFSSFNTYNFAGSYELIASLNFARILPIKSELYISRISNVIESSFDIGFQKKRFLFENDSFAVLIRQKPYTERGKLELNLPIGRDKEKNIQYERKSIFLEPSKRNISLELIWSRDLKSGDIGSFIQISKNSFNTDSPLNFSWLFSYKEKF
ncbi:MAG: hypothetical protein CML89_04945 [Rhodobiaceae bacterium]|nr:hypothetical protein [Rhodobiaceae bacterium]